MSATNINTKLFDKSYQESKSPSYKLYTQISYSEVSSTILDTSSNTFVGYEKYLLTDVSNDFIWANKLNELLGTVNLFKAEYKKHYISIVNNRATLVPNAIFKPAQLENYHRFNFSIQEDDLYNSDKLINLDAHNVYSIPRNISDALQQLKNITLKHFSSALIEASLIDAKKNNAISSTYVNVEPKSFQIIVIKNQKLELFNSFNYESNEDFIYFLLFVLDQLNINNEEATLNLSGAIALNDELYSTLYKYIKTLQFVNWSGTLKKSYVFEEVPNHFHYGLFNQYLCE